MACLPPFAIRIIRDSVGQGYFVPLFSLYVQTGARGMNFATDYIDFTDFETNTDGS
jgi:hypothetical protein